MIARANEVVDIIKLNYYKECAPLNSCVRCFFKYNGNQCFGVMLIDTIKIGPLSEHGILMLKERMMNNVSLLEENNILIVLIGNSEKYRYKTDNLVMIDYSYATVKTRNISLCFWDEKKDFKNYAKKKATEEKIRQYRIGDEATEYLTWAVYLLIAICVYAYMKYWGKDVSAFGISVQIDSTNEYYRYITYMFMHGNMRHLVGNMISLLYVGKMLCKKIGSIRFLILYIGGGVLAAIYSIPVNNYFGKNTTSVGASGALFAVLGALLVITLYEKRNVGSFFKFFITTILLSNLGYGIDVACHVCGVIAGIALAFFYINIKILIRDSAHISNLAKKYKLESRI